VTSVTPYGFPVFSGKGLELEGRLFPVESPPPASNGVKVVSFGMKDAALRGVLGEFYD
jgi:hypothetical protein